MADVLFNNGVRLFDVLVLFVALAAAFAAAWGALWWRRDAEERRLRDLLAGQKLRLALLEQELAEAEARYDPARLKALREDLESLVAHEFVKGLNSIIQRSRETLEGLPPDEIELRDRQRQVIAQGYDLAQRSQNIVALFELRACGRVPGQSGVTGGPRAQPPRGREALQREMVAPRALVEAVLKELFPYAEAHGVVLRPSLATLEPVPLNRHLVAQAVSNLIHNAIKYSPPSSAVDVELRLLEEAGGQQVCLEVRDRGQGIAEGDRDRIFEPHTRGDGLVQPGSGLGLYFAREIARLHGGDLVLVESGLNQGSTFRMTLPYS